MIGRAGGAAGDEVDVDFGAGFGQGWCCHNMIDPPAFVVGERVGEEIPKRVAVFVRIFCSVDIHELSVDGVAIGLLRVFVITRMFLMFLG